MSLVSWFQAPPIKALGLAAAIVLSPPMPAALAASPFERFLGVWTGGGQVVGTNGHRESMRCRAEYAEAKDGAALSQTIVCASECFKFNIQSYAEASGESVQGYWREVSRDVSGNMTGRISAGQFVGEFTAPTFSAGISLTSNGRASSRAVGTFPTSGSSSSDAADVQRMTPPAHASAARGPERRDAGRRYYRRIERLAEGGAGAVVPASDAIASRKRLRPSDGAEVRVGLRGTRPLRPPIRGTESTFSGYSRSSVDVEDFCRPMVALQRQDSAQLRHRRPRSATSAIRYVRFTSTPVIFDAEPIVKFSLLGPQCSISGSTRGRPILIPRLKSPINIPGPRLSALPSKIRSYAANPSQMLVFPLRVC
jgi:hypothetical protein